jgi:dTDP-4-dehydrorhamnose reductase
MKRVLVTGASGLLGRKIVEAAQNFIVCPTHQTRPASPDSIRMDLTNEGEVAQVFRRVKPDVVIHAAAETNVDKCERDMKHAWRTNADGTRILAEACSKTNVAMLYISTDYVFDGEKGRYKEEDEPIPVNYYGLTKLMGEEHVKALCKSHIILRTSVLYGTHPYKPNFATWIIASLAQGRPLTIVEDHFNSPTLADNLAQVAIRAIGRARALRGIYHVAGSERISRYNFGLRVAATFNLDAGLIKSARMSELRGWIAKRPKDSSLCVDKIRNELDVELLDVTRGLAEMKKEWAKTK